MTFLQRKILGLFVKTKGILSKPLFSGIGHIYMLHRVLENHDKINYPFNHGLALTPQKLEEVILHLKAKKIDFISMDEVKLRIQNKSNSKYFIAFTLDDGYLDNLEVALPIFEKHKIPICIYITTSFPNKTATFWWYLLEEYVTKHQSIVFTIKDQKFSFEWQSEKELRTIYPKIKAAFKTVSKEEFRAFILATFQLSEEELNQLITSKVMNWEQLKKIAEHPLVTIGSHTVHHSSLTHLSKEKIDQEIGLAQQELEEKLGVEVRHFAYPYGGHNDVSETVSETVKQMKNIETAVLNLPGNIFYQQSTTLERLPRYPLGDYTTLEKINHQCSGIEHYANNTHHKTIALF